MKKDRIKEVCSVENRIVMIDEILQRLDIAKNLITQIQKQRIVSPA